uniref:OCEL domain-containing protein n=1 Tax=Bursaphelenchus xylophilus TaxID=6326 RepID=A0A1I7S365_BURXY
MRSHHSPNADRNHDLPHSQKPVLGKLHSDEKARSRRSFMLKLTDECNQALSKAIEMNWPVRVISTKTGVIVDVGIGPNISTKFNCSQQTLNGTLDAVCQDAPTSFQTISSVKTKLVVNATEKTFAETREKAAKLVEQELKKKTKETELSKNNMANRKRPLNVIPPNGKPNVFAKPSPSLPKRTSPPLPTTATKALRPSTAANGSKVSSAVTGLVQNKSELLKKSVRERVVHLCAGGKYKSEEEVLDRLKFEGFSKKDNLDDLLEQAKSVLTEVAIHDLDALTIKPECYNEIDIKWPGFVSSEKARARRLISTQSQNTSMNVAPTRKSGVAPVLAPSAPHGSGVSSKSQAPSTPVNIPESLSSRNGLPSRSPAIEPPHEDDKLRKRLASPIIPPRPLKVSKHDSPELAVTSSASSTASPVSDLPKRPVNPNLDFSKHTQGSMSIPVQCSTDWDKVFPMVQDSETAVRYHELFESEYPIYRKCYEKLAKVSAEFSDLKRSFDRAPLGSSEQKEILRQIYDRYHDYQSDGEFYNCRTRHANLHGKLAVLKRRITEWDQRMLNGRDLPGFDGQRGNVRHRRSLSSGNSASSTTSMDSSGSGPHGYDEY